MGFGKSSTPRGAACWLLVLIAIVAGCGGGDPLGEVAGKVTLDGQPLSDAYVVFEDPGRGISVTADLNADGTYRAQTFDEAGLPPGEYRVAVRPGSLATDEAPLVGASEGADTASASPIPRRYADSQTSELTARVAEGENEPFDFKLTTP